MLTEEQIMSNWETFIEVLNDNLEGKRKKTLIKFYEENAERFSTMPASGNKSYHNAFPGGYVSHVLGVYSNAKSLYNVWKEQGAFISDFTIQELMFTVLNHDLGKFGDEAHEYYVPQTSDWHIKNKGEVYLHNPQLSYMKTADRSLFILQSLGVELSENEYLAIKLHDGLYEDSNKGYYISYSDSYRLRPHLSYILHQADLMASRIEYDNFNRKIISLGGTSSTTNLLGTTTTTTYVATGKEITSFTTAKEIVPAAPAKRKITGKYAHLLNK